MKTLKKSDQKHKIYQDISGFYPLSEHENQLPLFLSKFIHKINRKVKNVNAARFGELASVQDYDLLVKKYSQLPEKHQDPLEESEHIIDDLFNGVLRWRSPYLQHNVGSPVHTAAAAMYSIALDENIYSIDDGLAGNALVAEKAVVNILSGLAKLENPAAGFFVFGGTATNIYASKVGLQKAYPNASVEGVNSKVKLVVTEDSHFTHRLSADWLGIGTNNVLEIRANSDRTSNLEDAELKIREAIESGYIISAIMLNGGTTYNHTVDSIKEFVELRDKLVSEYKLKYKPHIHVDAVIGWSWLFFGTYDFEKNPLGIGAKALRKINEQYEKISELKFADSWGVDFHKGIGGCPVDCSVVLFNNPADVFAISKSKDAHLTTHQLATEFTKHAPSEFTLETSRSGGTGLAALATLRSLGLEGYQRNLANLIEGTYELRENLEQKEDVKIVNDYSLGFSTMVRIYPPELLKSDYPNQEFKKSIKDTKKNIELVNKYIKAFYRWDFETRIAKNEGPSPSCSSSFFKHQGVNISALKFYPTSPHFSVEFAKETAHELIKRKAEFDTSIWPSQRT